MLISNVEKLEFGDYQTPIDFCDKVTKIVQKEFEPDVILEPTFGVGNFIKSSSNNFKKFKTIYGIEINNNYFADVNENVKKFIGFNENIFEFNHNKIINEISEKDKLLIIGNPPWITNSQLMSANLQNLPQKNNFKRLNGFNSITGSSNFDICEYIIIDLLNKYKSQNAYIAMLCKTSVVINIIKEINKYNFSISDIKMYQFDAKKVFNVSCESCLFCARIGNKKSNIVNVFNIDNDERLLYKFGWKNNKFYSNFNLLNDSIDGKFPIEWRQGIKHDCSKVMELKSNSDGTYENKLKETLKIESNLVYPLLKSSDIKENYITQSDRFVIVPQKKIKQETTYIKKLYPKLWNYLSNHKSYFDARKSSIYKNCPRFSIFGIGEYSFSKYKVAVSGFYKKPNFSVLSADKPIMLDDTCYFIGFENEIDAIITMVLLNSPIVQDFLYSIAFLDKKRPYTKDILMRIDLAKVMKKYNYENFFELFKKYNFLNTISCDQYENFKKKYIKS